MGNIHFMVNISNSSSKTSVHVFFARKIRLLLKRLMKRYFEFSMVKPLRHKEDTKWSA
jgi:hypothetical protein